jgi:hypothetical protein
MQESDMDYIDGYEYQASVVGTYPSGGEPVRDLGWRISSDLTDFQLFSLSFGGDIRAEPVSAESMKERRAAGGSFGGGGGAMVMGGYRQQAAKPPRRRADRSYHLHVISMAIGTLD